MKQEEAAKKIRQLTDELNRHNDLYYVQARPEMSDHAYDLLYKELEALEKSYPDIVQPDSPTQRVGGKPMEGFRHVQHVLPMLSLDNVFYMEDPNPKSKRDLRRFDTSIRKHLAGRSVEYVLEPKIDGVSINLRYERGVLTLGASRGDGTTGDDITANIKTVRVIPLKLKATAPPRLLEVRGEAYMELLDLREMNQKLKQRGEDTFENPRNATAGSLKNLDPRIVAKRPLKAVFYSVGASEGISFSSQIEILEKLESYGLPTQKYRRLCPSIEEVFDKATELEGLRMEIPYEIDGAVVKVNDLAQWKSLGETSKSPRYAVAYKFLEDSPENRAETKLLSITIQVGRTGTLTPVAELEPVALAGSTISRATLHNEDEIARKDIRLGDQVIIKKAGMVIPAVMGVVKEKRPPDSNPFDFFNHVHGKCPECGGPIRRDPKFASWRCKNLQCPAQNIRRLEHFCARSALNIEGLGGIVAEKLVESGLVTEPLDLFDCTLEDLSRLNLGTRDAPRIFGEKNASKLFSALEASRNAALARWIHALGIPNVGKTAAFQLAKTHQSLEELRDSPLLRNVLRLENLKQQRIQWNPNSRLHPPACSTERKEKEAEAKRINPRSTTNPPKDREERKKRSDIYQVLQEEIRTLRVREKEEKRERSERFREVNEEIGKLEIENRQAGLSPEIGPVVAGSVLDYFSSHAGRASLNGIRGRGIAPRGGPSRPSGKSRPSFFDGKTFVITGTLSVMTREQAADAIRARGGNVSGSVSGKTVFVIVGENPGQEKLKQARSLGIPELDETGLRDALGEKKANPRKPEQEDLFSR